MSSVGCSPVGLSVTTFRPSSAISRSSLVVLAQEEVHVLLDLVRGEVRLPRLDQLLLLQGQARPSQKQPAHDILRQLDVVLLQLSQRFSVVSTVRHEGLAIVAAHRVEELLQGSGHLNSVIIFEGLVQD